MRRPQPDATQTTTKSLAPPWFVYILLCANGRLYTGITTNLAARFRKHATGKGAMFTKLNRPTQIIAAQPCKNRSEASKLECKIKSLKVKQKRDWASKWPIPETTSQAPKTEG